MNKRKEEVIQEIIKLKTNDKDIIENKLKIQKLQQELDQIENEEKNSKNL